MKKLLLSVSLLAASVFTIQADPILLVPDFPIPNNQDNQRAPIVIPEFDIVGHVLTAGSYTLGSTVELLDENGNVNFSTYVNIEGDIALPATLRGTYTILVIRDSQTFVGEITL